LGGTGGGASGGNAIAGTVNTGGGGGGQIAGPSGTSGGGGGGSGVVILRYPSAFRDAANVVGATLTNTGGFKTYIFTKSGSILF
jgi:hypothetical protein